MDRGNSDSAVSDLKSIMANVNRLTGDLQSIVGDLKKGKGTLGKMLAEDEIADQVKQTLSSVQKIVGKADSLRTELSVFSGMNTERDLVEFVELPREVHPFYVGTQAHPEFKSRPTRPHPLFAGLIKAAIK